MLKIKVLVDLKKEYYFNFAQFINQMINVQTIFCISDTEIENTKSFNELINYKKIQIIKELNNNKIEKK